LTFSVADSCGKCEFCLRGLNQKCVKLFKVWKENNNNLTSFTNIYIYSSIYSMVMLN
jgi:Zn-dependent alcohol dehydrogenase